MATSDRDKKIRSEEQQDKSDEVKSRAEEKENASKPTQEKLKKPESSYNEFFSEIKAQYVRDLETKNSQDNKANNMITMSSAIATLLIGLGTFLVSRIEPRNSIFLSDVMILSLGIILSAAAIACFINSYKVRRLAFPYGPDRYYKNGQLDASETSQLRNEWKKSKEIFIKEATQVYILATKSNEAAIKKKAKYMKWGHWCFFGSVLSISLVLAITLGGLASGISSIGDDDGGSNPVPNAGETQIVDESELVRLDATQSQDPDGSIVSYVWKQNSGIPVNLSDYKDDTPTFVTPPVENITELEFELQVTDNAGSTSQDVVNVIIDNGTMQVEDEDEINSFVCNIGTDNTLDPLVPLTNTTSPQELMKCLCFRDTGLDNNFNPPIHVTANLTDPQELQQYLCFREAGHDGSSGHIIKVDSSNSGPRI